MLQVANDTKVEFTLSLISRKPSSSDFWFPSPYSCFFLSIHFFFSDCLAPCVHVFSINLWLLVSEMVFNFWPLPICFVVAPFCCMTWGCDSKSFTDIFGLPGFLHFCLHIIPSNMSSLTYKSNVISIPPGNSTCPGPNAPRSPEGALSEDEIFTFCFLLEETVILELTNKSCHLHFDLMRVDTEALRLKSEVRVGPRLTRPMQGWERWHCQTSLHLKSILCQGIQN